MKNKTVIPGIQGQSVNQNVPSSFPKTQSFQSAGSFQPTLIPGVNTNRGEAGLSQLAGFLYSASKTLAGEFWPIYLGSNTIGRASNNNIVLQEATVSDYHAEIHVISRANKIIVYVKDDQSKTGTLLNGELLRNNADLKTGDVITVGEHYELYVVIINPSELGLKVNEAFIASEVNSFVNKNEPAQMSSPATIAEGQVQPGSAPVGGHTVLM